MIALSQAEQNFQLAESIVHECAIYTIRELSLLFISDSR
jgi:hypothetical protein